MRSILFVFLLCSSSTLAARNTLQVAAASDLIFCLEKLNLEFEKDHPDVEIKLSIGSSGNFSAQIKNGAPFDVFLSADVGYATDLIETGFAAQESLTPYGVGRIVLWTTRKGLDVSKGLSVLEERSISHIAIANPDHAPYGRAAKAALEHEKLWSELQPKIVLGENIAQTAQFVETGNADAGIVALSLVLSPKLKGVGSYFEIPSNLYPRLEQAAVITRKGISNPASNAYLKFLKSDSARNIFEQFGFSLSR